MSGAAWVQVVGVLLAVAGLALLFGPWALVASGAVLLMAPEVAALVGPRRPRGGASQ